MEIVELHSPAQRSEVLPILRELYPWLDEGRYAALLAEMIAMAGIAIHVNLYYGRHLYVYDLVVKEDARSKGYGGLLMDHVEGIARREACETVALAVSLDREAALRLYERRGYQKPSYAMRKALR